MVVVFDSLVTMYVEIVDGLAHLGTTHALTSMKYYWTFGFWMPTSLLNDNSKREWLQCESDL